MEAEHIIRTWEAVMLIAVSFGGGALIMAAIHDARNPPPPRNEEEYQAEVAKATARRIEGHVRDARRHIRKAQQASAHDALSGEGSTCTGIYTSFSACLEAIAEDKRESDAQVDDYNNHYGDDGGGGYPYQIYSIQCYTLDSPEDGDVVYQIQGDKVLKDERAD